MGHSGGYCYSSSSRDEKLAAILNERIAHKAGFQIVECKVRTSSNCSDFLQGLGISTRECQFQVLRQRQLILYDDQL